MCFQLLSWLRPISEHDENDNSLLSITVRSATAWCDGYTVPLLVFIINNSIKMQIKFYENKIFLPKTCPLNWLVASAIAITNTYDDHFGSRSHQVYRRCSIQATFSYSTENRRCATMAYHE